MIDGATVPDLVFSEMKFLRKKHGGNDHSTQAPDAKKKRKRDSGQTRDEDISSFFTTVRPVLADINGKIHAKSGRSTDVFAGAEADHPRRMKGVLRAADTTIPTADSEDKAPFLGVGSRGPRHESTSCFSWSESIRAPSFTPGRPEITSTDHDKRIDALTRDTDTNSYGKGMADQQEVSSSAIRDRVTATSNRVRMSSVAPTPSVRSQSIPQPSSPPRWSDLVDRAVKRYTNSGVASPSSKIPLLRERVHAGHAETSMAEGLVGASYVDGMQRPASTDIVGDHSSHNRPPELLEVGETLHRYIECPEAEPQQAPARIGRRAEAQPSVRPPDTVRQSRHDLRCRTADARFAVPDAHYPKLSIFSGPSLYVRQEQRQHLAEQLGPEGNGGYRFPGDYGQGCMSGSEVLDKGDFDELSDIQVPYGLMEDIDEDVEGSVDVTDDVEQVQEHEHMSVVTPGFWRPNRLY